MEKRQLLFLLGCSLIPWTVGNGILPLLPVYAAHLGASSSAAGAYLAISYVAITLGALCTGWLADRLQSRKTLLLAVSLVAVPLVWLTGRVTNLWELTAATASLWFLGGMGFALTSILAGLGAKQEERGQVFGVLSMAGPAGMLVGGLTSGPMVDCCGFPAMFAAFALFSLLWPVAALMAKDTRIARPVRGTDADAGQSSAALGRMFWLLFAAGLAASIANFVSILGRSWVMIQLGFSAAAISSTGAVGGAVALPLGLLSGVGSDRLGRKGLLAFGFLASALGLGLLSLAASLWHFWLAISLVSAQNAVSGAVGSALVADLIPKSSLGKAMAFFSATTWIGGVIGFAATGFAIQAWANSTFLIAAVLPLLSAVLLIGIRHTRQMAQSSAI